MVNETGDESIYNSFCRLIAGFIFSLLLRFKTEFLAADSRLEHQPALGMNEHHCIRYPNFHRMFLSLSRESSAIIVSEKTPDLPRDSQILS